MAAVVLAVAAGTEAAVVLVAAVGSRGIKGWTIDDIAHCLALNDRTRSLAEVNDLNVPGCEGRWMMTLFHA